MTSTRIALTLLVVSAALGATALCPLCDRVPAAQAQTPALQGTDTAVVRLHISGMTCGTCPATARLALRRLAGVHDATVTLRDSLGVVRYDPRRTRPADIAAHLTRLTGYGAVVLPDTAAPRR
jgi:mercuric ion binding protein